MGQISATGLATWVSKRILAYFNGAITAKDITGGFLKDDPGTGTGKYVIGEVVAQRILDRRNTLPGRRYTDLTQLDGIQGLGVDKFHDLVYTFGVPAAEAFKDGMYANVIAENWALEAHTTRFEDAQELRDLVEDPRAFQKWLSTQIGSLATAKYGLSEPQRTARKALKAACPEIFANGHVAAYAFALWFYRFDADNWFNFETVRKETEMYLDFMQDYNDRIELRMYHGFENVDLIAEPLTVSGLP
ncbi:MAG: hypothetical protein AAF570_01100, partial [Bacteroidota bacterium]